MKWSVKSSVRSSFTAAIVVGLFSAMPVSALSEVSALSGTNEAGAKAYKRCAACHLATGKGVPGAFPPIDNRLTGLMATPEGRDYLVMIISAGLMGPIAVDGMTYRGIMPAQGNILKHDGIANALNYIATDLSETPEDFAPFTAEEVKEITARHKGMNSRGTHGLRQPAWDSVKE
ncbi:hypothetical protein GCM10017044_00750 [Kordiimonas sediminis]|uniref:Cytochrome c domain-containing protein n=1 Tax=Kordiimonas sediminis TaxID=1735581 RepID=A0A919AIV1_9PROT|nr:cytochrome c [Kordiimonas sediminis]GHF10920.1 hypothetical protein GCM10017044_00750 [Kordiimonas sediminis]